MPCQSYESNWASDNNDRDVRRLKAEADKLARFACAAMTELEKMGKSEFLVLKNPDLHEWWEKHKEDDRKEQARLAEIERRERVKAEALARLTAEEKELLGLAKPKKRSKTTDLTPVEEYEIADWGDEYDLDDMIKLIQSVRK